MSETTYAMRTTLTVVPEVEYLNKQAIELVSSGNQVQARELLDKALAVDPFSADTWFNKGNCLDDLGSFAEAVECYNQAIRMDPGHAETWYNKGISLKKMGRTKEAESCINHAVSLALGVE
jgi:tetratricopeptide (TPR) repeat protein